MIKKHLITTVIIGVAILFVSAAIYAKSVPDVIPLEDPAYKEHKKGVVKFEHKKHWDEYEFYFFHVKKTDSYGEDGNFDGRVHVIEELDDLLPEIMGLQVLHTLRQTYSMVDLPIIMVTTQKEAQENKAAYAAGVNDIIHKPFTEAQIGKALAKFSGR